MNEKTLEEARDLIAGFLKDRRIELKLSQQELADRTGLARKTINAMEGGKFWLGMKQYLQICEALHLFPFVATFEEDSELAEMMRKNWAAKPKAMSIEEALKLKAGRHKRPDEHN